MSTPTPAEITTTIHAGLWELQDLCGSTAASKGFHDDRPSVPANPTTAGQRAQVEEAAKALANWQGNKLLLIVSEVIEAHDEIRSGHAADETYYPTKQATTDAWLAGESDSMLYKPEGVPSEIADAVIRCFDFAYTEGFSLADIIIEKLQYNATRERLHGKKF
jgi:hypothetical protein